ncbi:hypothetical protein CP98_05125 [Sphingobium yanoikuyae]|uniref:Uncharacterized protein n=1 Tax=Sphingobium yanoikuyae TaxID=13690 RepID=A0A084E2J7_SPHYA|nr:hypothetical protein CP98_05125 [Sphingobium yanoikuyae]
MSFSSSCGINSSPRSPKQKIDAAKMAIPLATNGIGLATALSSIGAYFRLNQRIGFTSVSLTLPFTTIAIMAGMKVIESTNAEARASISVVAIGENVLPSTPSKVRSGTKTRKMISCPNTVGLTISCAASRVSSMRSVRVNNRPWCSCRSARRRNAFSTMMTAPSTMSPKSRAPRLIRLPETPSAFMPEAVISIVMGMTAAVISAARMFPRRRNSTTMTSNAPSVRFFSTVQIVALTSLERL